MEEVWKDIYYVDIFTNETIDYRGLYQVSNFGRIRNIKKSIKIIKNNHNNCGYSTIGLSKNGKRKYFMIHRLVAYMFIMNDDKINKTQVNHKDENKNNNNVENLEWCTCKYNINYGNHNKKISETLNGRKLSDSHKENLRKSWDDERKIRHKENCKNRVVTDDTKRKLKIANKHKERKIIALSLKDNRVIIFNCTHDVTKMNFDRGAVGRCCKGKQKQHLGFIFYLLDDYRGGKRHERKQ